MTAASSPPRGARPPLPGRAAPRPSLRGPPPLGPVADRAEVDRDHRGHEGLLVAERHGLADVRAELELVLDELGRERRAVGERADSLGAVDDDEMPARIHEAGVAGVEPAVTVNHLAGRLLVLEVATEDPVAPHQHLAAIPDPHLDARARPAGRGRVGLAAPLGGNQARGVRGAGHLLWGDAGRTEGPG